GPFLSFVSLGVADLDRAVRFYRDGLGCAAVEVTAELAILDAGSVRLALLTRTALFREAGVPPGTDGAAGTGSSRILLSFNVGRREEVAALLARAKSAGGRIVRPAAQAAWGGESGVFADPD